MSEDKLESVGRDKPETPQCTKVHEDVEAKSNEAIVNLLKLIR